MSDIATTDAEPDGKRDDQLQRLVSAEIEAAVDFIDRIIGPERELVMAYDAGDPFGNEEEGRSQIISRDVHDTRVAMLPAIQRVFFGDERVMEFAAGSGATQDLAEQQTDHVHHVIMRENEGYEILSDAFVDALRSKAGFVKAWAQSERIPHEDTFEGLDAAAFALLQEEFGEDEEAEFEEGAPVIDHATQLETFDVTVRWVETRKSIKIAAVPPEELLINIGGRCIESARIVAHRRMATRGELVELGIDQDVIEGVAKGGMDANAERLARNPHIDDDEGEGAEEPILYIEAWLRVDFDGDGIAELRRICTLGDDFLIVSNDPCDIRPIADFRTMREPHTFFPESLGEKVMDVQRIKSMTLRAMMDSLALATNPRMAYDPSMVEFDDAANSEIGALIAVRGLGGGSNALVPIETPFVGQSAFPALDYLDTLKENRTGVSRAAAGLDAGSMQGSSRMAVAGTYSRADAQAEMIARDFAEGGMKRLYRLVLRLTAEHQKQVEVRARTGEWVTVDPRGWKLDLNLDCNVVIGVMSDEEKLATLEQIAAKQELAMQTLGVTNPFAGLKHYHATLSKMLAIRGWKDSSAFFADPETLDPQALAPPPKESPEEALAKAQIEVERMKAERELIIAEKKLQLEVRKLELEDDRKRDEMAMAHTVKLAALEAEFGFKREQAAIQAEVMQRRASEAAPPVEGAAA